MHDAARQAGFLIRDVELLPEKSGQPLRREQPEARTSEMEK